MINILGVRRMKKSKLKQLIKECCREILKEGRPSPQMVELLKLLNPQISKNMRMHSTDSNVFFAKSIYEIYTIQYNSGSYEILRKNHTEPWQYDDIQYKEFNNAQEAAAFINDDLSYLKD